MGSGPGYQKSPATGMRFRPDLSTWTTPRTSSRADVAAYYQYIDHERLSRELVRQTGRADLAEALVQLLSAMMGGRGVGVPQNNSASDRLADAYLDVVERQLIRGGRRVWRYNDDFHIGAVDWRSANESLHILDRLLAALGLTLNDEKTTPFLRESYEDWITKPEAEWARIVGGLSTDIRSWSPYDDSVDIEADMTEEEAEDEGDPDVYFDAAVEALELWRSYVREVAVPDPLVLHVHRRLVSIALTILTTAGLDTAVGYCRDLVAIEPQLTGTVAFAQCGR